MKSKALVGSVVVLVGVALVGGGVAFWKWRSIRAAAAAPGWQEMPEMVVLATAGERPLRASTTAIGTVVALQSVELRNEVAGTVRQIELQPGAVIEPGAVLVQLDVSVEEAELRAAQARQRLATQMLDRQQQAVQTNAASAMDLDRATAERDQALAEVERIKAVIERKTIRAPFRARVGLTDTHVGQYLAEGTSIAMLEGVDTAVNIDVTVPEEVAERVEIGQRVEVMTDPGAEPREAEVIASDARADRTTRNVTLRARLADPSGVLRPGASVRVRIFYGPERPVVTVPVTALRRSPQGTFVFVASADQSGTLRASMRPVRAGPGIGDQMTILSGLSAGDRVVGVGSFKLREGAMVMDASSAPGGAAPQGGAAAGGDAKASAGGATSDRN